jgi:uncharacterized protein involved in exopolysaccharide biosynthesis
MTTDENRTEHPLAQTYPYAEEDEINLLDLLLVLLKHKWLIFIMIFLSGAAAVFYSLSLTNIYRSEATITPRAEDKNASIALPSLGGLGNFVAGELGLGGGGSLTRLEMVLTSQRLTDRLIRKYKLMPIVLSDIWDANLKKWTSDKEPTQQDGIKAMKAMLKVNVVSKKETITIGFEHKDPQEAKKIVEYYILETSELIREVVLRDAAEKMRFFRKQLNSIADPLLKEKIYVMLANEIEKETFARVQKYYSFYVVDPPLVPDMDKKVKPKRALICILSVVVAFFVAIFLSFFIEFIKRVKSDDPERYRELADSLKPWGRRRPE